MMQFQYTWRAFVQMHRASRQPSTDSESNFLTFKLLPPAAAAAAWANLGCHCAYWQIPPLFVGFLDAESRMSPGALGDGLVSSHVMHHM